jgi:quinol monooxygenase YgiN
MVLLIGAGKIKPEKMPAVLEALEKFLPTVKSEEGTLEYRIYRGTDDPNLLVFYEKYKDEQAHQAHGATEEIKAFSQILWSSLAGEPVAGLVQEIVSLER